MNSRFASLLFAAGACLFSVSLATAEDTGAPATTAASAPVASSVNVSLIEFTVPDKLLLDLVLPSAISTANDAEASRKLFDELVKAARSGEVPVKVTSGGFFPGTTGTVKSVARVRYPESYSQVLVSGAPGADVKLTYPVGSQFGPNYSLTGPTPQDYVEREVGIVMEVVVDGDKAGPLTLDIKAKRVCLLRASGAKAEAGTLYPSQPEFGIREILGKYTVTRGEPTWAGTFPPNTLAKDAGTTVVFIIAK